MKLGIGGRESGKDCAVCCEPCATGGRSYHRERRYSGVVRRGCHDESASATSGMGSGFLAGGMLNLGWYCDR